MAVLGLAIFAYSATTSVAQAPAQTGQPFGQPAGQAIGQPTALASGNVDLARSRVFIFVGKSGFGHEHGVEGLLSSGTLQLGAAQNAGQLVFDMRTFDADTPVARKYVGLKGTTDESTRKQVNDNMRGAAVLDVSRYPTATFKINAARQLAQKSRNGNLQYLLDGVFTLHGVSRPLQVAVVSIPQQGATRVAGNFEIQQTQFGIKPFSKGLGLVGVTDELRIYGDLQLTTAPRAAQSSGQGVRQ
ncbi:MAG: YceI family protein [Planctomycetales bacterium]|nr:YceI family protein [Planctomycetales bacterium]